MDSNTKNILIAGASGLAVGAVLGVLFAPAEGKKTRANIKEKANQLTGHVSDKLENPDEMLAQIKEHLNSTYKDSKADVKDELLEKIEALEATLKKA